MGIEILRLGEFNDIQTGHDLSLQNTYQITFHPIPKTNFKIGYLPRSLWPSEEVLHYLKDYGKKHNVIFFKLEPYITADKLEIRNSKFSHNITKSPHPLFPEWTMTLDISKSEEELLANCKQKTRYNIRLAQKKGVVVKEMSTDEGFELFSKLYFETTRRQKYYGHTQSYHKIIWEHLKAGIAHILIAFYEDTPLAAYELFKFHDTFYYPYGGSSNLHRNLMGANLIMWEAILLGKKLGATKFDMWGSLPPDYNHDDPWAGFTRFKEGYSAEFTHIMPSHDLVVSKTTYSLYNAIYKLRQAYLKLRR
jgi:lipid II:glycine glycyltransferase (peptidoglycan interpeptide bridge formation enzyme)